MIFQQTGRVVFLAKLVWGNTTGMYSQFPETSQTTL